MNRNLSPPVLLLIDLSYHTHRAVSVNPHLSSNGVFTGGLFGFFSSVAKMIRETEATAAVFCRDSKPYLRSEVFPEYKQIRKKAQDPEKQARVHASMKLITDALQQLGWPIWSRPGLEADDLMGHAAIKYRHRFTKIYLGSNDSDLFQLLWIPNLALYSNDIRTVHTLETMLTRQGLTPEQHTMMTAITGTHNDLPGVSGYGPATALKAMKDPMLFRKLMEAHGDVIRRNLSLIKLPHDAMPKSERLPMPSDTFHYRRLYNCLGRYDITVTQSMIDSFTQIRQICPPST
jgi:DNA polymerase-1